MDLKTIGDLESLNIKLNDDVVTRKNSDGSIILMKMSDGDVFYKMDGLSSHIYKELEQDKDLISICNTILGEYDVTEEVLMMDLNNLIVKLREIGFIQQ